MTDQSFNLILLDESEPSNEQIYPPGILEWSEKDFPIPLMHKDVHGVLELAGYIESLSREGDGIRAEGSFTESASGDATQMLLDKNEYNIKLELANVDSVITASAEGASLEVFTRATITGAIIESESPDDDDVERISTVVASAIPLAPPKKWFDNPQLSEPTMITVTPEGRIFGHVAAWSSCHVGYLNKCVPPPRSQNNYINFNNRPVETEEGEEILAGPLTFGVGHASLTASAKKAREHYDNVNAQIGQIRVGEDEHGIWMAGALNPDVDELKLRKLKSAAVSGDWRNQELQGVLSVNIPGFPVPRAQAHIKQDKQFALVAAGVLVEEDELIEQGESIVMAEEEKTPEEKELTFDAAVADFGSQLQALSEKDPESEVAIKSKELLATLNESISVPEEPAVETVVVDKAHLESLEAALVKIGQKLYKK